MQYVAAWFVCMSGAVQYMAAWFVCLSLKCLFCVHRLVML